MKTISIERLQENKVNPFARAAVLLAFVGCYGAPAPRPATVIEVPARPIAGEEPHPESRASVSGTEQEALVPTEMTLLRTGNTFLAYVAVPDGDGMRDLEDPKSAFSYSAGRGGWTLIAGCEHSFSCDAAEVISANPSGLLIKAEFSEGGYRPCSSEPHPVKPSAPSFLMPP